LTRKNEGIVGWWNLLKHVTKKRYKKGYGGYHIPLYELLESYKLKTTELNSMKEIDQCLENIK
jgi:elongation factor P--beta-lysine ligase